MKRGMAAIALAGAALSFSGAAQAQESKPAGTSSDSAPAVNGHETDGLADGFVEVFNKQTRELLSKVVTRDPRRTGLAEVGRSWWAVFGCQSAACFVGVQVQAVLPVVFRLCG